MLSILRRTVESRLLRWLRTEIRQLGFVTLIGVLVAHAIAFLAVLQRTYSSFIRFQDEILVVIVTLAILSIVSYAVGKRIWFYPVHVLKYLLFLVVVVALDGTVRAVEFLLFVSITVEICIYEQSTIATLLSFLQTSGYVIAVLLAYPVEAGIGLHVGYIALAAVSSTGFPVLLVHYREKLIADRETINLLNSAFENLTVANLGLQDYISNVESESAKRERQRITRELHDSIGYALTSLTMMMNAGTVMARDLNESLKELLENARDVADQCLTETRTTLYKLRSIQDQEIAGIKTVFLLVKAFRVATGIDVRLDAAQAPTTFGAEIDRTLFRFVQEGITNALRHGKATRIHVHLYEHDHCVTTVIWDNGTGAEKGVIEGIGLRGMRERFEALGGEISATSRVDGFELRGTIPV